MALFTRRRSARSDDPAPVDPHPAEEAPLAARAPAADVVTPDTLWRTPDWATLPPITPSLPEMPSIVSPHFEDDLVSRKPPERFLGELGHSVSDLAPAGVVEGVAVLSPLPALNPAHGDTPAESLEPLTLAVPPAAAETSASTRPALTRRLDGPGIIPVDTEEAPVAESSIPESSGVEPPDDHPATPGPPEDATGSSEPEAPAEPGPNEGPGASADLIGSAPLTPVVQPLVTSLASDSPARGMVQAPVPPDMPLAVLPAEALPEEQRRAASQPEPAVPRQAAPVEASGLVGERAIVEEPAAPRLESIAPPSNPEPTDAVDRELPLAPVAATPPAEADDALPDLPVAPESPSVSGGVQPDASPVVPSGASAAPDEIAPLVGQAPPIAGDREPIGSEADSTPDVQVDAAGQAPAQPPAPRPRRSGLGEPMEALPPTATSWDLTRMSPAQQRQASRSLVQRQMAAFARNTPTVGPSRTPLPVSRADEPGPPSSDRPDTVLAGTPMQTAIIQRLEPTSAGVTPAGLLPASLEQAPVLAMDPLVGPDEPGRDGPSGQQPAEGVRVRYEVGRRHGVDLSNVPVDRSAEGAAEASRLRARAFTSDSGVVIPARVGSLESGPGQAVLAHELTHVAQRARLGPDLPSEGTPAGRLLEAEALATEMTFQPAGPPPLASPAPPARPDRPPAPAGPPLPLAAPAAPAAGSLDADALAATLLDRMSALSTPASPAEPTQVFTSTWSAPPPAPAGVVQRADEGAPSAAGPADQPAAEGQQGQQQAGMPRPSEEDLNNLSKWLYPLIRYRLKGDLREDRERAGLLTDHYRRW